MKAQIKLKLPYVKQGKKSGNCGPCSIKMIADYYGVKKESGRRYTVRSLNRLCNVTREFGCEKSDINRVLKKLGLERKKVTLKSLSHVLKNKKPVISLLIDEEGGGHYAVINGITKNEVIFNDSFWGKDFKRNKITLKKQVRRFDDWMWAVEPRK